MSYARWRGGSERGVRATVESGFAFPWGCICEAGVRVNCPSSLGSLWHRSRSQCPSAPGPLPGPDCEGHSG